MQFLQGVDEPELVFAEITDIQERLKETFLWSKTPQGEQFWETVDAELEKLKGNGNGSRVRNFEAIERPSLN